MKSFKILFVLLLILLSFKMAIAQYFSDDGFYNGMSKISVQNTIRAIGLSNLVEKEGYILGNRKIDGYWLFNEFHFCEDKLVFYRKDILPSIKNLIFILNNLTSKYGNNVKTFGDISMTPYGEQRSLMFVWETNYYYIELSYEIFPANESLNIRYSVPDKCIDK